MTQPGEQRAGELDAPPDPHLPNNINALPQALLHQIFGQLGPKELARCTATCRFWKELSGDEGSNALWQVRSAAAPRFDARPAGFHCHMSLLLLSQYLVTDGCSVSPQPG